MENIFKNSQNNGMVQANSTRNFLSLFQKQYETGLGNRGRQMLMNKISDNNRGIDDNTFKAPIGGKNKLYMDLSATAGGEYVNSQPPGG